MDQRRFDDLARFTHSIRSRRGLLVGALAAMVAVMPLPLGDTAVGKAGRADRRRRRRSRKRTVRGAVDRKQLGDFCQSDGDCVDAAVCIPGRNGLLLCKPAVDPNSCRGLSEQCQADGDCCGALECLASDGFVSCQVRPPAPGNQCANETRCGGGATCADGRCVCDADREVCDDRCINTLSDASFCGDCETSCKRGERCVSGTCRCGDSPSCTGDTVCTGEVCVAIDDGSGQDGKPLPLFGWGGGICAFGLDNNYCLAWWGDFPVLYGAVRRWQDGDLCFIEAKNEGKCNVCIQPFAQQYSKSCRPQVTPTDWQIRKHCTNVKEYPSTRVIQVDCSYEDCQEKARRNPQTDMYECNYGLPS